MPVGRTGQSGRESSLDSVAWPADDERADSGFRCVRPPDARQPREERPAMADDLGTTTIQPVIPLWPDGPPGGRPHAAPEIAFESQDGAGAPSTMLRNISQASLTVFVPDPARANGTGVIVCPGGGWRILAWNHEGLEVARWLTERGYAAFLLKSAVMATPADPAAFEAAMAAESAALSQPRPSAEAPRRLSELI